MDQLFRSVDGAINGEIVILPLRSLCSGDSKLLQHKFFFWSVRKVKELVIV